MSISTDCSCVILYGVSSSQFVIFTSLKSNTSKQHNRCFCSSHGLTLSLQLYCHPPCHSLVVQYKPSTSDGVTPAGVPFTILTCTKTEPAQISCTVPHHSLIVAFVFCNYTPVQFLECILYHCDFMALTISALTNIDLTT